MAKQVWKYEPTDRWIRGKLNSEIVVDSKNAIAQSLPSCRYG